METDLKVLFGFQGCLCAAGPEGGTGGSSGGMLTVLAMLRSGMRHETTHVWGHLRAHGRALHTPGKRVGMRRPNQRGDDVWLRQHLK